MKKFLIFSVTIMFSAMLFAQTNSISKQQLPKHVIEFIDTWYKNYVGPSYWIEYDNYIKDEYEVRFSNGTTIEFTTNGVLKSIDCGRNDYINKELLPKKIQTYLKQYYPSYKVVEFTHDDIGRRWEEYEVDLLNGRTITFNRLFNVIELD